VSSSNITIKDVAKKAGVSIATVSRFLNNPGSLKENNRKKVEKAVEGLDYKPLLYARRLAGGRINTFGLIIPGYEGIFYSYFALEILRGVAASLDREGTDLHLHISWDKDNFNSSLVEGVIFADVIENDQQLKRLLKEKTPLVVINKKIENEDVSYVAINNFKGGYDATEFLINHGHKKIAHFAGDLRVQCAQERLDGARAAMEKNGLKLLPEYTKITNFSRKETRENMEVLFASSNMPTAIFCCSDEVASEVLSFAEEKDIMVPESLSIIGFDDNPRLSYGSLMLTTVRQPLIEMSSVAVRILKDTIDKKMPPQRVILDTELIIRDTVTFLKYS